MPSSATSWRSTPPRAEGGNCIRALALTGRITDIGRPVASRRYQAILSPAEVLERFQSGPKTGVFTDGSCEGNPGPGGWAAIWVEKDQIVREMRGDDPDTTNNRMELMALIQGLKMLPVDCEIPMYSDSQLCVKTVNEWAAGWAARGWRRKSGPIANLELVKELYALSLARPGVKLTWIRAHDGSRWNEYADALASGR